MCGVFNCLLYYPRATHPCVDTVVPPSDIKNDSMHRPRFCLSFLHLSYGCRLIQSTHYVPPVVVNPRAPPRRACHSLWNTHLSPLLLTLAFREHVFTPLFYFSVVVVGRTWLHWMGMADCWKTPSARRHPGISCSSCRFQSITWWVLYYYRIIYVQMVLGAV